MNRQLAVVLCAAVVGFASLPSKSWAQAKTAKACTEEWRADKAGFQAKGITEKAYVTECRAGGAATPTVAPAPAPAAPKPTVAAPAPAPARAGQGKTAKACTEEWRADKAGFQARGITEKAYVTECRGGVTAVPTAAPAPAPAAPAPKPTAATPAPAPAPATAERPAQAPVARAPSSGTPAGAGQFATEAQAKANCPIDTIVWANLRSKIYHFSGTHNYGNTKDGAYMCERDTAAQGMRAAKNEQHP
jgi:hypothetical protein